METLTGIHVFKCPNTGDNEHLHTPIKLPCSFLLIRFPTWHITVAAIPESTDIDEHLRRTVFESRESLDHIIDVLQSPLPVAQNPIPTPNFQHQARQSDMMDVYQKQISSLAEKMNTFRQDLLHLRMGDYDRFIVMSEPDYTQRSNDWVEDEENVKLVTGRIR